MAGGATALLLLAAAPAAAMAPPPVGDTTWRSWEVLDAKVEVSECEPYTQDDRILVSREKDGRIVVEHCVVDGGQYVPATDVAVEERAGKIRITYLIRDLPYEPMQPVAACSSTPRLTVWFDAGDTVVEAVEVRGFRLAPAGKTREVAL